MKDEVMMTPVIETIGDLRKYIAQFDDEDQVVLSTTDPDTGDDIDTFAFAIESWRGLILEDGTEVREVRLTTQFNQ